MFNNRFQHFFFITVFVILSNSCISHSSPYEPLPERYQKEGLITSNTYQIQIDVIAISRKKAIENGKQLAINKAYNMMIKEPSLKFGLGLYGRKKIKSLIESNGKIVYLSPSSEESWQIVFQVYKKGLWDFLRNLN